MNFLVISSSKNSLINFREPMLSRLGQHGTVFCLSPRCDLRNTHLTKRLTDAGFKTIDIPMQRKFISPFADIQCIYIMLKVLRALPNVTVVPYTLKPIFLALIALYISRFFRFYQHELKFVPMITGLGAIFTVDHYSISNKIIKKVSSALLSNVLGCSDACIVQNFDDREDLLKMRPSLPTSVINVVDGSGVDLRRFPQSISPQDPIFAMVSRLITSKGIITYLEAASIIKGLYPNTKFLLAGPIETSASSKIKALVHKFHEENIIHYYGLTNDVNSILKSSRYFVNPSFYREGIPRSSLEALANGRPIITTSTPGNKEVVIDNYNGFVIPPRSTPHLVNAMVKLLNMDKSSYEYFSRNSLALARSKFDAQKVALITAQIILNA